MTNPTSPAPVSKKGLWVALSVLGGGIVAVALLVTLVVVPSIGGYWGSQPDIAPDEYGDLVPEPLETEDMDFGLDDTDTDVLTTYGLPASLGFSDGEAITSEMTVSVLANVGDMPDGWSFTTPPDGFLSSYSNGACTSSAGTYTVSADEYALGDEEATYLAGKRLIGLEDRSMAQTSEWGWSPNGMSASEDATASMVEARWNGNDGKIHSAALRSVGTSGVGVMYLTSCSSDAAALDAAVSDMRTVYAISVLNFKM